MKITDVTLTLFSWEKHRFAVDSPLEGGVCCEPVSESQV
jgi:hypothetical protein